MRHRRNWPKRMLAGLLSATMLSLNIATAVPTFAATSAEVYREDAELVNDLALSKDAQRRLQRELQGRYNASPSDATPSDASKNTAEAETVGDILAGNVRWGTPSNAAQILHTTLDGVEI